MAPWIRFSSLIGWTGVCALALLPSACSLGDFDSLGAGGLDQNVGGSGGRAGSGGTAGTAGTAGSGGTSGSGGDGGSGGSGGSNEPVGVNLIDNPGFETGASQWMPIGPCLVTMIDDPTPRPDSTKCLRTTNRTDTWNGPMLNLLGRVTPGNRYSLTVWARTDAGDAEGETLADGGVVPPPPAPASSTIGITMKRLCAATDPATGSFTPLLQGVTSSPEWTELVTSFVAPDCVDLQEFSVYVEGAPPGESYCIDDTSLIYDPL